MAPLFSPVASKMQVSWAKGKLSMLGVPPLDVAQAIAPPQFPPAARFQYLLTPAPKVIPLLPFASPKRVPDTGAAAPAMVMSRKSASVPENAAVVIVRVVPMVSDRTKFLLVALVPAEKVSVPVTVWSAVREIFLKPTETRPVKDRLLKLFAPLIVTVPSLVLVKATL